MAEAKDPAVPREESNMNLGFTFLREDLQEVRQDIRALTRRFDEMGRHMDQRFTRQTATMIAVAGAIIAAVKL